MASATNSIPWLRRRLLPNIEAGICPRFSSERQQTRPLRPGLCFLNRQYGDFARFPLRSRHSAPDNAANSVNLSRFEETDHDTPHSLGFGWRHSAHWCGCRGRPTRPATTPPPYVPLPWTGFYVGLNAGYEWSNNVSVNSPARHLSRSHIDPTGVYETALAGVGTANLPVKNNGFIGGGQIG